MAKAKVKAKSNKMLIAVVVLSVALILALGGMVGILAAMQQNIKTSFSVSYSIGDNVAVAVGASSIELKLDDNGSGVPDTKNATWFTASNGTNETFSPQENHLYELGAVLRDKGLILSTEDATFTTPCHYLCFYFENLSDEKSLSVTYTNSIVADNMNVGVLGGMVESTSEFGTGSDTMPVANGGTFTVAPGKIYCLFLSVQPIDTNKSAKYETTDTTGVSFLIQQA